ncbi:hypothetical protein [Achromobacter phage Motura]|uniref:Uncharacterized protein n=1 Tax=Achromobacter phage Motura TaxID=2591403 RepID=A0A514CT00_9CAUD|nr:hypothetical protein H1O15_gp193 [Achromobacter phage Motura]QDH83595.1 hypothetical protein [Achromobacter phage Motura]
MTDQVEDQNLEQTPPESAAPENTEGQQTPTDNSGEQQAAEQEVTQPDQSQEPDPVVEGTSDDDNSAADVSGEVNALGASLEGDLQQSDDSVSSDDPAADGASVQDAPTASAFAAGPVNPVPETNEHIPADSRFPSYFVPTQNATITPPDYEGGFTVCRDGLVELGVAVRYTNDDTTVLESNAANEVTIDRFGTNGEGWYVILSAYARHDNPVNQSKIITTVINAFEGEEIEHPSRGSTIEWVPATEQYRLGNYFIDPEDKQSAIFKLDFGTRRGRYVLGLTSEDRFTGQLMTASIIINAQ